MSSVRSLALALVMVLGVAPCAFAQESYSVIGKTKVVVEAPPSRPPPLSPQRVVVSETHIHTLEKVFFRSAGAEVMPESLDVLDEIAQLMASHPSIAVLKIEAHTDSVADPKHDNHELSQRRAEWVREYLMRHGVERSRMKAVGFGASQPLASNATPEGRQRNRRVEFVIGK